MLYAPIGEILSCEREVGNIHDTFALAIKGQLKWKINLILNDRSLIITQCGMGSFLLAHLV